MKKFSTHKNWINAFALGVILLLWGLVSQIVDNAIIIPTIGETLRSLLDLLKSEGFFVMLISSLLRTLMAFGLSLVLAVTLGLLAARSPLIEALTRPLVHFSSSVPVIAVILLALIWLKPPQVPVFVALMMVFPILYKTVYSAINNLPSGLLEMAAIYKVSPKTQLLDLYLPAMGAALGEIAATAMSTALKVVIAGEVLSQPKFSIGSDLQLQKMYLNTPGVFAWIIIILLLSKALQTLIDQLIQRHQNSKRSRYDLPN